MKEAEPDSQFSPCPNCGLKGGRCCPADFYFSDRAGDFVPGRFEVECGFCGASASETTEAAALDLWDKGQVITPLEWRRKERDFLRALEDRPRPTRRKPGEEAPEF